MATGVLDLRDLGAPAQLWHRWVLLAAGHAARREPGCEIRDADACGHLDDGRGAWLRMRRLAGGRAVVWGHHRELRPDRAFADDLLDSAPDWAYDVDSAHANRGFGFLAWYAHAEWWSVPPALPRAVSALLAPVASDAAVCGWWQAAWPTATPAELGDLVSRPRPATLAPVVGRSAASRAGRQVRLGQAWATRSLSDTATAHLRAQVHLQMRGSAELADRGHAVRPPLLRQWGLVNLAGTPFRHAVCAVGQESGRGLSASATDTGLEPAACRSLDNVLAELRAAESDPTSGAWLFAQVRYDGRTLRLERAYDTWPSWYVATGPAPTMAAMHAEMEQRSAAWRPTWARLLPADRF